jgi:hypothetical protein
MKNNLEMDLSSRRYLCFGFSQRVAFSPPHMCLSNRRMLLMPWKGLNCFVCFGNYCNLLSGWQGMGKGVVTV